MADELDQASERMEFDNSVSIRNVCDKAKQFDAGQEGNCDLCGEFFKRVIRVVKNGKDVLSCGRCRDKHGIK